MNTIRKFDPVQHRVETGPIQFGEDWPGIFIRGDNAIYFAYCLRTLEKWLADKNLTGMDYISLLQLNGLAGLLEDCNLRDKAAQ